MELPVVIDLIPVVRRLLAFVTSRWFIAHSVRSAHGDRRQVTEKTIDRYYGPIVREGNREAALRVIENFGPSG